MADGQFNRGGATQRPKHALNDFRFRLVAQQRLEGGNRPPTIGFDVSHEGVRVIGYTNVQDDKDRGVIRATISLQDAMFLITLLERAERIEPGAHDDIPIAESVYDRASNSRKPKMVATLRIGKNDHGVIYLGLSSWERTRPVIQIDMLPSNFIKLIDRNGNPAPLDRLSALYAVGWAKALSQTIPTVYSLEYPRMNAEYEERRAQKQQQRGGQGGQGGGGYGGGNYGGGGYNAAAPAPAPAPASSYNQNSYASPAPAPAADAHPTGGYGGYSDDLPT